MLATVLIDVRKIPAKYEIWFFQKLATIIVLRKRWVLNMYIAESRCWY